MALTSLCSAWEWKRKLNIDIKIMASDWPLRQRFEHKKFYLGGDPKEYCQKKKELLSALINRLSRGHLMLSASVDLLCRAEPGCPSEEQMNLLAPAHHWWRATPEALTSQHLWPSQQYLLPSLRCSSEILAVKFLAWMRMTGDEEHEWERICLLQKDFCGRCEFQNIDRKWERR